MQAAEDVSLLRKLYIANLNYEIKHPQSLITLKAASKLTAATKDCPQEIPSIQHVTLVLLRRTELRP